MSSSQIRTRILRICLLVCLIAISGCDRSFQIYHDPMHPIRDATDLKASATGLIDRIELRMQRFTIDPISGNETPETGVLVVRVCDPLFTKSKLECTVRAPWAGDARMVEFQGRVVFSGGGSMTETYKFAMGEFPLENSPVPIRVNRHPLAALDVIVVPDLDLQDNSISKPWTTLRWYLDDIVDESYFDYNAIHEWRGLYNFYYSRHPGTFYEDPTGNCVFAGPTDPDAWAALEAVGDALVYAHVDTMRDCRYQIRMSSEVWYGKSLVHETGHALIDLRDEYRGANFALHPPHACMSNIFHTLQTCQAEAPDIGWPQNYCVNIDPYLDIWRIDPADATGSIMGEAQHRPWSWFSKASLRRIEWRYEQCIFQGNCMVEDECDYPVDYFADLFGGGIETAEPNSAAN